MNRFVPSAARTPVPSFPDARATTLVDVVDPREWDAVVGALPGATVFHRLPWLRALATAHELTPLLLRATREGRTVGAWPCLTRRKGPFRVAGSPFPGLGTPYMGPVFAPEADVPAALEALLDHEVLRRSAYVSSRVIDRSRPVDLARFGFSRLRAYETSWLDLHDPEAVLWKGLKSECRTRVRRAEKLGVEVRREESPAFLDEFWAMTLETFARSGSPPTHSRRLVEEVWRELHPAGQLLVLSAFQGASRLSTLVLPFDDEVLYYWAGGSFDRYRPIPAGNLLQWRAIVEAKRLGLGGYDMISANRGSGRFKRSFGAKAIHAATHWERCASPFVSVLRRGYEQWLLHKRRRAAEAHASPANPGR